MNDETSLKPSDSAMESGDPAMGPTNPVDNLNNEASMESSGPAMGSNDSAPSNPADTMDSPTPPSESESPTKPDVPPQQAQPTSMPTSTSAPTPTSCVSHSPLLRSRVVYGICCAVGGVTGLQRLYVGDWQTWLGLTVFMGVLNRVLSSAVSSYATVVLFVIVEAINIFLAIQVLIKSGFTADPENQHLFIAQEDEKSSAKTTLIIVLIVVGVITLATLVLLSGFTLTPYSYSRIN
jgi:hypothetical protein